MSFASARTRFDAAPQWPSASTGTGDDLTGRN